MKFETALEVAARIWCDHAYSHVLMDESLARTIAELLHAHANKEQVIAEAIGWLLAEAPGDLSAGELRRQVVERFGAEVDAELARRFTKS